ncbi:hypothetical protein HK102_000237 [Quaeritorhiza haematococci]|nr:hypothetical protein HK102_000237 [Quaeritorhiza haematococci]
MFALEDEHDILIDERFSLSASYEIEDPVEQAFLLDGLHRALLITELDTPIEQALILQGFEQALMVVSSETKGRRPSFSFEPPVSTDTGDPYIPYRRGSWAGFEQEKDLTPIVETRRASIDCCVASLASVPTSPITATSAAGGFTFPAFATPTFRISSYCSSISDSDDAENDHDSGVEEEPTPMQLAEHHHTLPDHRHINTDNDNDMQDYVPDTSTFIAAAIAALDQDVQVPSLSPAWSFSSSETSLLLSPLSPLSSPASSFASSPRTAVGYDYDVHVEQTKLDQDSDTPSVRVTSGTAMKAGATQSKPSSSPSLAASLLLPLSMATSWL